MVYYRPICMSDLTRPPGARVLAGGWCWFDRVEVLARDRPGHLVPVSEVPADVLAQLTAPRAPVVGLGMDRPHLMGILNVTPDSFSDGGQFLGVHVALSQAQAMVRDGASIIDVGGESTRPGAALVPETEEMARVTPVIAALRGADLAAAISLDTRKAGVARAGLAAGAAILNDVSAMTFDPSMAAVAASSDAPICLMHAKGTPADMQTDPRYGDVLLDVYDFLAGRIAVAMAAGIARDRIIVDPGIGFGKTVAHNLDLIRGLSLFHGLGCPILLGASRKKFIGVIGGVEQAHDRMPGSVAVALAGVAQGVQITRVHDVSETRQALALWQAIYQKERK